MSYIIRPPLDASDEQTLDIKSPLLCGVPVPTALFLLPPDAPESHLSRSPSLDPFLERLGAGPLLVAAACARSMTAARPTW
jgi:hypothetical protein